MTPGLTLHKRGIAVHILCVQHRLFGRAHALLPPLLLPLRPREVFVRELRGRAAVLDRAGELDRPLQDLCEACGYSKCASGSTTVDG